MITEKEKYHLKRLTIALLRARRDRDPVQWWDPAFDTSIEQDIANKAIRPIDRWRAFD